MGCEEKLGKDIEFESFESETKEKISVDEAKKQEAEAKKVRDVDA